MKTSSVVLAIALAASTLSATDRAPAPPDAKTVAQRIARDADWYRRNLLGHHTCDASATEALTAMVQAWSDDPNRPGNEQERAWKASQRAVKAGCDDAMVLYTNARMYDVAALESTEDAARLANEAASALDRSTYGAGFKMYGHVRAAQAIVEHVRAKGSGALEPVVEHLDAAAKLWPALAKEKDAPDNFVVELLEAYLDTRRELVGADRKELFAPVIKEFEAQRKGAAIVPLLRTRFLIEYAWDARGGAYVEKTTDQAFKVLDTRLADAEKEFVRALAIDPASPALAPLMLQLELGQARGRERMESWFRYGTAVDPGNFDLWWAKLHYLEPRWHGSDDAMIEFGREVAAEKNWTLRLPFILVAAHYHLSTLYERPDEYLAQPEVCRDLRGVYDGYLAKYDAPYERSAYALTLHRCGDSTAAHKQFQKLGADRRIAPFGTRAKYEKARTEAALRAK